jgi:hypothetical protein
MSPKNNMCASALGSRYGKFCHMGVPRGHFFSEETRDLFFSTFKVHLQAEENIELMRGRLARRP